MEFNHISLLILLAISLFIVCDDIRHKKIRNKSIMIGFCLGACLFAVSFFLKQVDPGYLLAVLSNTAISFVVAFLIWRFGIWPAGDAKFFVMSVFLLPLHYYRGGYFPVFPAIVLLINIFVPFIAYLLLKAAVLLAWRAAALARTAGIRKASARLLVSIKKMRPKNSEGKIWKSPWIKLPVGVAVSFILVKFYFRTGFTLKNILLSLILFGLAKAVLNVYLELFSLDSIRAGSVEPGMNLGSDTVDLLKKDQNFSDRLGSFRSDGLDREQAGLLNGYFIQHGIS